MIRRCTSAAPDCAQHGHDAAVVVPRTIESSTTTSRLPAMFSRSGSSFMRTPWPTHGHGRARERGPGRRGFARVSGIPYGEGVVKNRYIGRTFIAPSQEMRARGVRMKLNPLRENIAGKRLVVVDDSIVRGTTTGQSSRCCARRAPPRCTCGSSSPPYRWPCFYGMDTGDRGELLAANLTVEEIRDYLDVDTLAYLNLDRLIAATGAPGAGFCAACFTGDYPVAVAGPAAQATSSRPPAIDARSAPSSRVDEPLDVERALRG